MDNIANFDLIKKVTREYPPNTKFCSLFGVRDIVSEKDDFYIDSDSQVFILGYSGQFRLIYNGKNWWADILKDETAQNNKPISKEEIDKDAHYYSSHILFPDDQLLNDKGQKRVVEWATQDFIAGANHLQQKLILRGVIKSPCLLGNEPKNCNQFDALGNCEKCKHKNSK